MAARDDYSADFQFLAAALQDGYIFLDPGTRSRFQEQAIREYDTRLAGLVSPRQFWMLLSEWLASLRDGHTHIEWPPEWATERRSHPAGAPEDILTRDWLCEDPPILHLRVGDLFLPGKENAARVRTHLDNLFRETDRARAAVLDLRGNGGGTPTPCWEIVSRLIADPVGNFRRRWFISDTFVRYHEWGERFASHRGLTEWEYDGDPEKRMIEPSAGPRLRRGTPTMILVDGRTCSRAEQLAVMLQEAGMAQVAGWKSAGAYACPIRIPLPRTGWQASFSVGEGSSALGYNIEKHGVPLDYPIESERADLNSGEDTLLVLARNLLIDGMRRS